MSEKMPQSVLTISDFLGLVMDVDPHDAPPGASEDQVNATVEDRGVIKSREGFRVVSFES